MGETEMQCRHLLFCPFIKQPRRQVMVKQLLQRNLKVSAFSILLHSGVPTKAAVLQLEHKKLNLINTDTDLGTCTKDTKY